MTNGPAGTGARRRTPRLILWLFSVASIAVPLSATPAMPVTQQRYLSGHGPADAVPWSFQIDAGRRPGEAATIPVPSNWELQGFGTYRYGQERNKEVCHGHYRTRFEVPEAWHGLRIRLVFGGVMTDTAVRVNGHSAGPIHQGGFTEFRYDITPLVTFGAAKPNSLDVDVSNTSADPDTELAERGGDYWVFGGIYRPVWLEAVPAHSIEHVAIDARADGTLTADVALSDAPSRQRSDGLNLKPERIEAEVLDAEGRVVGSPLITNLPAGGAGAATLRGQFAQPRLWTAETPNLYTLRVSRLRGDQVVHVVTTRFGFRTFEVRDGQGLFLNGQRILLKGVSRHSFRPETGRALTREDCYDDVRLMRRMNMNAVRMSHYPPDPAFLEACDELGLYALDELSGWQHAHGTPIGRQLVREMVERDVNHPSILFWDNGNEGGFNHDLDREFGLYDPQHRRVLHPWDTFSGVDTRHYPSYDDFVRRLAGRNVVMPTEILHGMYDGGAGSGLEDYWRAVAQSPVGGGFFIWNFADEGVVRTDQGGRVDVFSTFAPDGIVGPHFEREGSYYTVRDVWCPVQITPPRLTGEFDGTLHVRNTYDFTDLARCRFTWRLVRVGAGDVVLGAGTATGVSILPHHAGTLALSLPGNWQDADLLQVTATDPGGAALWTWSWVTASSVERTRAAAVHRGPATPTVTRTAGEITLGAGDAAAVFDARTGELLRLSGQGRHADIGGGPRLVFARPASAAPITWLPLVPAGADAQERFLTQPQMANAVEIETDLPRSAPFAAYTLELSSDGREWHTVFAGSRRPGDTPHFEFPPQRLAAIRVSQLRDSDERSLHVTAVRVGYAAGRFPNPSEIAPEVTVGTAAGGASPAGAWIDVRGAAGEHVRWTMHGDGSLQLDFQYDLRGEYVYHGITFDLPESEIAALRWFGDGPSPVYQNRRRGTVAGEYETPCHDLQPGTSWEYPDFHGYYANVQTATLRLRAGGSLVISNLTPGLYLRVGTPRLSHPNTTVDFPAGELSFLFAIPAMGSKFKTPEESGPSGQPAHATGRYQGTLVFRLAAPMSSP